MDQACHYKIPPNPKRTAGNLVDNALKNPTKTDVASEKTWWDQDLFLFVGDGCTPHTMSGGSVARVAGTASATFNMKGFNTGERAFAG